MVRTCARSAVLAILISLLALSSVVGSGLAQFDQDATATTSETIWFVIAPDGKANGEYFEVDLNPGESAELTGWFGNGSKIPVEAIVYAADARSAVNGGLTLNDSTADRTSPTTWIDFPIEVIAFQPEELLRKSFRVTVPPDAPSGQYISGVAIETLEAVEPGGSATSFLVKYRLVAAVVINVPGPLEPSFEVGALQVQTDDFATIVTGEITNTGNVRVRPTGSIVLTSESGVEVANAVVAMGSVYGGHTTTFQITLPSPIPEGNYSASVDLHDPDTGARAWMSNVELDVSAVEAPPPVTITRADVTPMPSASNVVFTQIGVTISNTAAPIAGVEVAVVVSRDGEVVDTHTLATSVTLQNGETTVDQSYIPATAVWEPGTYTFEVTVTSIDPVSGSRTLITTVEPDATIEIP